MNPEQQEYFMQALWNLLEEAYVGRVIDGKVVKLRDSEFRSGVMLLACAAQSNGYVNMTHEEARYLCGTDNHNTMRGYLVRLSNAGILKDKCLNGTARVKFTPYPGRELITSKSSEVLTTSSEVLTTSTLYEESSEKCCVHQQFRAAHQQFRAVCQQFRAVHQHHSRNFDAITKNQDPKLVSQLDRSNSSSEMSNLLTDSQPTTRKFDPVEEAMSVALLLDVGFWTATAKELAQKHSFELLRRAVAHWWCNRRSVGGKFAERPGIVLTWLGDLEHTTIPALSREFLASELYARHRTKEEVASDEASKVTTALLDRTSDWTTECERWDAVLVQIRDVVPPSAFVRLDGTTAEFDDIGLVCTVITDSDARCQWLEERVDPLIRRTLATMTGQQWSVRFEVVKAV